MSDSLDQVKNRLRQKYLGKGGIHGLGISRAEQAVRVYVDPAAPADGAGVLDQLRAAAKPFKVIVIEEERPRAT